MTYQDKITSARLVVDEHNENLTENKIDFDAFLNKLKSEGGTSEQSLAASSWEDLVECGLPKLLAKQVAGIFRQKEENKDKEKNPYSVSPSKASKMSPRQLLEAYDPNEPDSHVAIRLKKVSNGEAFIVFKSDGSVDIDPSLDLYAELRQDYPPRELYTGPDGSDVPRTVYSVGDAPGKTADENPLYPGRALRPDGTCTEFGINWSGVDTEIRQFIRLGRSDTNEIKIGNRKDIFDLVKTSKEDLFAMYQKTTVRFLELQDEGNLPRLKVKANGSKVGARLNDPFHKQY